MKNRIALRNHQLESIEETRQKLKVAFARLKTNAPKNKRITITSVAMEAEVDRTTLYRYHSVVLTEIRYHNNQEPKEQLRSKLTEFNSATEKLKLFRNRYHEAESQIKNWARENYALEHRILDLERSLSVKNDQLADLRRQLTNLKNVISLPPIPVKS